MCRAFVGLGIVHDFNDNLVEWAYDRERECDWKNGPYLLECLTWIANDRKSMELQTRVATCRSQGEFTLQDASDAAGRLGLGECWQTADESHIIGVFQSRLQDAPMQETQMKKDLEMVGMYIQSQPILDVANKGGDFRFPCDSTKADG